jgi:tripartite-type tricarboxylate transporter receptor subunit TctC
MSAAADQPGGAGLRRAAGTVSAHGAIAALAGGMLLAGACLAQTAYPNKPVRIVVPFAAGSGTDITARMLAEELTRSMGQNFLIDNKPGASAQIAADAVAKSAPDGYTLFLTTNTSHSANPYLFKKLPYDPVKDFTPIARTIFLPFMLVVDPKLPIKNVADLVDYARANPGKVSYGYGNSTGQVAGAALAGAAKLSLNAVPYKSTPPAMTDIIGGTITFMFVDLAAGRENVRAGRLNAIAMSTEKRSTLMPEIPAVAETSGFAGFDLTSWGGCFGPAGMPREIVVKLNAELLKILDRKEIRERLASIGAEAAPSSPDELGEFVLAQLADWGRKIREAGIQPE